MVAYESLFRTVGLAGGADPYFITLLPEILDKYNESGKTEAIKTAAEKAVKQLIRLPPPEMAPLIIEELFTVIEGNGKWRAKVAALELLATFATSAKDQVAERLGQYVPRLSEAMRDTKQEVCFNLTDFFLCLTEKLTIFFSFLLFAPPPNPYPSAYHFFPISYHIATLVLLLFSPTRSQPLPSRPVSPSATCLPTPISNLSSPRS